MIQEPELRVGWQRFWRGCFAFLAILSICVMCSSGVAFLFSFARPVDADPNTPYFNSSLALVAVVVGVIALKLIPDFILFARRNHHAIDRETKHYEHLKMMYHTRGHQTSTQQNIPQPRGTYYPQKTVQPITSSQQTSAQDIHSKTSLRNEIIPLINRLSKYDAKRTNNLDYDFDLLYQGRVVGVGQIIQHIPTKPDIVALSNTRFQQKTKLAYLFTTATVTDELKSQSEFQRVRLFDASDIATMRKKALN
jgi:hypothetical protein